MLLKKTHHPIKFRPRFRPVGHVQSWSRAARLVTCLARWVRKQRNFHKNDKIRLDRKMLLDFGNAHGNAHQGEELDDLDDHQDEDEERCCRGSGGLPERLLCLCFPQAFYSLLDSFCTVWKIRTPIGKP
jgi:hypothetical protein